jgi:hypothetical protein
MGIRTNALNKRSLGEPFLGLGVVTVGSVGGGCATDSDSTVGVAASDVLNALSSQ